MIQFIYIYCILGRLSNIDKKDWRRTFDLYCDKIDPAPPAPSDMADTKISAAHVWKLSRWSLWTSVSTAGHNDISLSFFLVSSVQSMNDWKLCEICSRLVADITLKEVSWGNRHWKYLFLYIYQLYRVSAPRIPSSPLCNSLPYSLETQHNPTLRRRGV